MDKAFGQARIALAEIYLGQRRTAEAVQKYREVLELTRGHPMELNNLAWLLATSADENVRNAKVTVALAERLCTKIRHRELVSLDTLAVSLAADGQFERAVESLDRTIKLARRAGKPTKRMEMRLGLFDQALH